MNQYPSSYQTRPMAQAPPSPSASYGSKMTAPLWETEGFSLTGKPQPQAPYPPTAQGRYAMYENMEDPGTRVNQYAPYGAQQAMNEGMVAAREHLVPIKVREDGEGFCKWVEEKGLRFAAM